MLGLYAPEWVARVLFTAKTVIGQLITFTIPLIILFFIMSGIASLPKNSGKLLGKTVALSYCSTILAGLFAFTVASHLIPHLTTAAEPTAEAATKLASYINLEIPPLFGVMSALAAAFGPLTVARMVGSRNSSTRTAWLVKIVRSPVTTATSASKSMPQSSVSASMGASGGTKLSEPPWYISGSVQKD